MRAGYDVVNRQFIGKGPSAAVLAGMSVALEDVSPVEGDVRRRKPVELEQRNDFRYPNPHRDSLNEWLSWLGLKFCPVVPVVELELIRLDHAGVIAEDQRQCSRH